MTTKN